jgi:hypothetical protein
MSKFGEFVSKAMEDHRARKAAKEAARAAYKAAKDNYLERLDAAFRTIQPIVDEGLQKKYISRETVAYHYCPEMKHIKDAYDRIKREELVQKSQKLFETK